MGKCIISNYKHGNGSYSMLSRNMIVKVFSNMDTLLNTRMDYLSIEKANDNISKMAVYVFGSSAYTFLACAISKYYGSFLYKKCNRIVKKTDLYINTILDTIDEDEMKIVFDYFATKGLHVDKFKVNGQNVTLTKSQLASVAILYALNHRPEVEKEVQYNGPEDNYIMTDINGNRTEAYLKLEEHRNMIHNRPAVKKRKYTKRKKTVKKVAKTVDTVQSTTEKAEVYVPDIATGSDEYKAKINMIKHNITKFSNCVSDNDKKDFDDVSELVMLMVKPNNTVNDTCIIHKVINKLLKDKPYMMNMFDMIMTGEY